jgi:hypothetical protein
MVNTSNVWSLNVHAHVEITCLKGVQLFFVVTVRNVYDRKSLNYAVLRSYNVRAIPYMKFIWLLHIDTLLIKLVRPNPSGL